MIKQFVYIQYSAEAVSHFSKLYDEIIMSF